MPGFIRWMAIGTVVMLGLTACGDDDGDFDEAAFCDVARELQEQDDLPSGEQLERYVDAAPDEIEDDAEYVAEAFRENEGNIGAIFSDPEIGERIENLEAAEEEHCGIEQEEGDDADDEPAEGATVVEVTGTEYEFDGLPEELGAGLVALGFENVGGEAHEMFVGKLADGTTVDEVVAFEGDPFEEGLATEDLGGAFAPPGQHGGYVNAELEPGTYGMVCFVPDAEGTPHAELGMRAEFTVS